MVHKLSKMDNCLNGSWEKFELWIRNTIGSDFRWREDRWTNDLTGQ
jgi:hypothetical protein